MRGAKAAGAALLAGLLAIEPAGADVIVSFDPTSQVVFQGDSFTVAVVAAIPEGEAVVGWGLDFIFSDPSVVGQTGFTINTPTWSPSPPTPDGDGLAALAPTPPGTGIWGNYVLLLTLELTAIDEGTTDLMLSDDYPDDLTEGFALESPPGAFAGVQYNNGGVTVIPEPTTLTLLACSGLALIGRRRQRSCAP
ncbi:MAG: PEP-CTERM sorting domain-containing protein [Phycisphaerae bacterium]|nr:PEP-CTERM sorting domain-containing protein [Phycisphaerae bacterium]